MEIQIQNGFQIPCLTSKANRNVWWRTIHLKNEWKTHRLTVIFMWRNLVLQLKIELNKHIMFSRVCEVASHVHGWWTSAFLGTSVWLHTPTPQIEAGSYCLHFEELRLRKMRWCVSVRQLPGSRLCYGVDSPAQCSFHQLERIPLCDRPRGMHNAGTWSLRAVSDDFLCHLVSEHFLSDIQLFKILVSTWWTSSGSQNGSKKEQQC